MRDNERGAWLWQYVVPSILMSLPVLLPWLIWEDAGGKLSQLDVGLVIAAVIVVPLLALVIGFTVRPKHGCLPPAVALVALWAGVALNRGMGQLTSEGAFFSLIVVGPAWMFMIWLGKVLRMFTVWLGRALRDWLEDWLSRRQRGPGMPAS
jgi:hypothetical protein